MLGLGLLILKEEREGGRGIRKRSTGGLGTVIFEYFYDSDRRILSTTAVWKGRVFQNRGCYLGFVAGFGVFDRKLKRNGGC